MFQYKQKSYGIKSIGITLAIAALVISCSSKKKSEGEASADGSGAPDISSSNMNFDPVGSDSGTISGLFTINFPYDQAILDETNKQKLNSNAEWIKAKGNTAVVQIEGHCDSRGSVEYNLALGERRAKAVKSYLVSLGVSGDKLRVVSYGEEKPLAQGETEEAYGQNRRANFVPLPN
ncbi:MAG: OmpA family protein [Bdellovibrionota bacterium]